MTAAVVAGAERHDGPVWHVLLSLAVAMLGFFAPFSTAGVALAEVLLVALALARPRTISPRAIRREPAMAIGLALFAFILVHSLLTSGWTRATLRGFNEYQELVLAPLLFALLLPRAGHRRLLARALIAGAVATAIPHWVALADPWWYKLMELHRISAGFALSLAAYFLLLYARGRPNPWPARALAAFFAATVLFAMGGRTGYLNVLLLAACAAWVHAPHGRARWIAAIATPLLVIAVALGSGAVRDRIHETLAGTQPVGPDGEYSSTTVRINMLKVNAGLARDHWLAGTGFGNYARVQRQAARERFPGDVNDTHALWMRADNPHSEYLMQLIGGGVVALALFLAWLAAPLREAARARPPLAAMLGGATLAFAMGCLFNSLLRDFVEGHLYVALLAGLLAELKDRTPRDRPVGRVLVVATRQIGDVLLTTPLVHAARERWPHARIDVLAFAGTAGMLRGNPDVSTLLEYPARLGWSGLRALLGRLWRRYDLALVTDPGDRAHLIGWVAAPMRSGIVPEHGGSNWLKGLALDHAVVSAGDLGSLHVTAEKQALLAPWRDTSAAPVPQVVAPPAAPLPAAIEQQLHSGAVVVHAPSMWPYKQWPIEHFRRLVAALLAQGRQVVLTGSGSARDQECIAPLRGIAPAPQLLDASGQLDFNQLSGLLRRAALYIGPDTSVSHLAAATGVPVIAIFGPTNPMRWAPWPARAEAQAIFARSAAVQRSGNVTIMQGPQPCVPCGRAGCEDHRASRSDCLPAITPEQVLAQAERILRQDRTSTSEGREDDAKKTEDND